MMTRSERRRRTAIVKRRRLARLLRYFDLEWMPCVPGALSKQNPVPGVGVEYWGKRYKPRSCLPPGRFSKNLTHHFERQRDRRIERMAS